jgi:DNA (cytosine-5)-methyltransferase 1
MSGAYYNEFDPFAAAWLRELIKAGQIAEGEVDERSIEDIKPDELRKFTQCHFFAGIGVWSYALRSAGWPDDRPVWTGSCPCQPFSAAGKRGGTSDERHLWPAFYHLIGECQPPVVFGEQVASKDGLDWIDTVQADMEAAGYAFGANDLCSAGFGAPHIRQRLYFVGTQELANTEHAERRSEREIHSDAHRWNGLGGRSDVDGGLADPNGLGSCEERQQRSGEHLQSREDESSYSSGSLEHTPSEQVGLSGRTRLGRETGGGLANNNNNTGLEGRQRMSKCPAELPAGPRGLVNGFWADAEWIPCRDQKVPAN